LQQKGTHKSEKIAASTMASNNKRRLLLMKDG